MNGGMIPSITTARAYLAARDSKPTGDEVQAFNEGCWCAFWAMHAYIETLPKNHPAAIELERAAEYAQRARIRITPEMLADMRPSDSGSRSQSENAEALAKAVEAEGRQSGGANGDASPEGSVCA